MNYCQEEYRKIYDYYAEMLTALKEREIKGEINAETRKVQAKIEGIMEGRFNAKIDAQMGFVISLLSNTKYNEVEIAHLVQVPLKIVVIIKDYLFS